MKRLVIILMFISLYSVRASDEVTDVADVNGSVFQVLTKSIIDIYQNNFSKIVSLKKINDIQKFDEKYYIIFNPMFKFGDRMIYFVDANSGDHNRGLCKYFGMNNYHGVEYKLIPLNRSVVSTMARLKEDGKLYHIIPNNGDIATYSSIVCSE